MPRYSDSRRVSYRRRTARPQRRQGEASGNSMYPAAKASPIPSRMSASPAEFCAILTIFPCNATSAPGQSPTPVGLSPSFVRPRGGSDMVDILHQPGERFRHGNDRRDTSRWSVPQEECRAEAGARKHAATDSPRKRPPNSFRHRLCRTQSRFRPGIALPPPLHPFPVPV